MKKAGNTQEKVSKMGEKISSIDENTRNMEVKLH